MNQERERLTQKYTDELKNAKTETDLWKTKFATVCFQLEVNDENNSKEVTEAIKSLQKCKENLGKACAEYNKEQKFVVSEDELAARIKELQETVKQTCVELGSTKTNPIEPSKMPAVAKKHVSVLKKQRTKLQNAHDALLHLELSEGVTEKQFECFRNSNRNKLKNAIKKKLKALQEQAVKNKIKSECRKIRVIATAVRDSKRKKGDQI